MTDVMDFDLGLFDESMDHLLNVPANFLEPVELFETPVESKNPELTSEEVTAADQLLDELLNYIEPVHEAPAELDADPASVMEEDKVFETLQPVLDLTPEEMAAPDQLLEELFKQADNDVTKVVTEGGKEVYILTLDTKMPSPQTPEVAPKRSRKARMTPYEKKEAKRVQDCRAAQKYRKTKKEEERMLKEQEQELVMKRDELKSQVREMETEVKTLKKLMVDLRLLPSSFRFHGGGGVSKMKRK